VFVLELQMRSISSRKVCANVLGGKSFWKDWRREAVLECSKGPGSSAKLYSSKSGEDRPSAIPGKARPAYFYYKIELIVRRVGSLE